MIERLGIVIHWIGFIVGAFAFFAFFLVGFTGGPMGVFLGPIVGAFFATNYSLDILVKISRK